MKDSARLSRAKRSSRCPYPLIHQTGVSLLQILGKSGWLLWGLVSLLYLRQTSE